MACSSTGRTRGKVFSVYSMEGRLRRTRSLFASLPLGAVTESGPVPVPEWVFLRAGITFHHSFHNSFHDPPAGMKTIAGTGTGRGPRNKYRPPGPGGPLRF